MPLKHISSTQNPLIKQITTLKDKSRERKKQQQFIIEGIREITLALKGGYTIKTLLFEDSLCTQNQINNLLKLTIQQPEVIAITKEVYQKIAYRDTTEGVVAIAITKTNTLEHLQLKNKTPLILVAEAPEKPGNIGALLRTADAANLDAVIIANPKTDIYNPNTIRSSVGCLFTNQIATGSTTAIINYLKLHNISIFCAALQDSVNYHTQNFTTAAALVVGTEATGLSNEWRTASTQNIIIPMQGEIDSMNVSVAAGILIFEAKRQRNFL